MVGKSPGVGAAPSALGTSVSIMLNVSMVTCTVPAGGGGAGGPRGSTAE
jgi:hypothetical protein